MCTLSAMGAVRVGTVKKELASALWRLMGRLLPPGRSAALLRKAVERSPQPSRSRTIAVIGSITVSRRTACKDDQ